MGCLLLVVAPPVILAAARLGDTVFGRGQYGKQATGCQPVTGRADIPNTTLVVRR
jgi:hypothetical protein